MSAFAGSRRLLARAVAGMALAVLAACGGGGGGGPASGAPAFSAGGAISRVVVAGDSLADGGTFGFKATVQRAADPAAGYPVYPEVVAEGLGLQRPCSFFSSPDGDAFSRNPGCTNFAVGGAMVVNPITRGGSGVPFALEHQLEAAVAENGGRWRAGDLLIVDAGANDAAALADVYLDARGGGAAEDAIFLAFLAQQLDAGELADVLTGSDGEEEAAALYMQRLAQTFWSTLKAETLDRGATRLAVLTVPDLTLTPRFRSIAAGLAASDGPAAASAFQSALRQWIVGFNTELQRLAAGDPRVAVVPYFADFTAQTSNPAAYGLTNVTTAACPEAADFPECTDAALDAGPPAGLAPGWWRTWFYSDGFHPSPRGHALLGESVARALARAGWR
jgi:phospholipase/lecithinase/hemolysin